MEQGHESLSWIDVLSEEGQAKKKQMDQKTNTFSFLLLFDQETFKTCNGQLAILGRQLDFCGLTSLLKSKISNNVDVDG